MTDTKPAEVQRVPEASPPRRRGTWIWVPVVAAVVVAGLLGAVLLWPDNGEVASVPLGDLTWTEATGVASDRLFAVTATPDGFLAAAPARDAGVEFWTSHDGTEWQLSATDRTAFAANELVWHLSSGPSGFVAQVGARSEDEVPSAAMVWTSLDGAVWNRSVLAPDTEGSASPYVTYGFEIATTVAGPDGFVAMGRGGTTLDYGAIIADFAPGADPGHTMWGETPSGLEIHTEAGVIAVPYTDLGISPEDRMRPDLPTESVFMWRSADGVSWETIDVADIALDPESEAEGWWPELIGTEDGFYLFTGSRLGHRSTDGRSWEPFDMVGLPEHFGHEVAAIDEGFLLYGATEDVRSVWTSSNGVAWSQVPIRVPVDMGEAMEFEVESVSSGPLGVLASGATMPSRAFYDAATVIVKDGYIVTLGDPDWDTLADEATGEVLVEFRIDELDNTLDKPVVVGRDGVGLTFTDASTEELLLVVTEADEMAAQEAREQAAGVEREPQAFVTFSSDLATWTMVERGALFGETSETLGTAVGTDRAVALIVRDPEQLFGYFYGESTLPTIEVWVASPAA